MINQTNNLGAFAGALTPSGVFLTASENGSIVNAYKSNTAFGWMKVQSWVMTTEGQFLRRKKRTALVKAETEVLMDIAKSYGLEHPLPGHIYVHEFLENKLPEHHVQKFMKNKNGYEAAIADFVKVHGETKQVMYQDGQRIIRFSEWDSEGAIQDIILGASNVPQVLRPTLTASAPETPQQQAQPQMQAALPSGFMDESEELPF